MSHARIDYQDSRQLNFLRHTAAGVPSSGRCELVLPGSGETDMAHTGVPDGLSKLLSWVTTTASEPGWTGLDKKGVTPAEPGPSGTNLPEAAGRPEFAVPAPAGRPTSGVLSEQLLGVSSSGRYLCPLTSVRQRR